MQKTWGRFDPWVRKTPWRRKWQPTPEFLPGESHGQRCLVGYSPWGHKRVRHDWSDSITMVNFMWLVTVPATGYTLLSRSLLPESMVPSTQLQVILHILVQSDFSLPHHPPPHTQTHTHTFCSALTAVFSILSQQYIIFLPKLVTVRAQDLACFRCLKQTFLDIRSDFLNNCLIDLNFSWSPAGYHKPSPQAFSSVSQLLQGFWEGWFWHAVWFLCCLSRFYRCTGVWKNKMYF